MSPARVLALSVLGNTAPWLLASNAALFLIWRSLRADTGAARAFARHWMLGQAIILLCCIPFYVGVLAAADRHMLQSFNWIPSLTWHHLWVVASTTYLMHGAAVVRFGLLPMAVKMLAPLLALLGVVGFYRLRGRAKGRRCCWPLRCCRCWCWRFRWSSRCWCRATSCGARRRSSWAGVGVQAGRRRDGRPSRCCWRCA